MKRRTAREQIAICNLHIEAAKMAGKARAATIMAEFEGALPGYYRGDNAEAWDQMRAVAWKIETKARDNLKAAMLDLGIPPSMGPRLEASWGFPSLRSETASGGKADIRRRAKVHIEAMEAEAVKAVSDGVLHIVAALHDGLDVDEAQARLDALPAVEASMPSFSDRQMRWLVEVASDSKRWRSRQRMPAHDEEGEPTP